MLFRSDPFSHRVAICNRSESSLLIMDAEKGIVEGNIPVGGTPEAVVTDGMGKLYVNLFKENVVAVVDLSKRSVTENFSLGPADKRPTGLAMDREHRRLFSVCRASKTMAILDADSGKSLASLPIGNGADGAGFDPGTGMAFASNKGSLTLVHEDAPDQFSVVGTLETAPDATTLAVDDKTHRVYLLTLDKDSLVILVVGKDAE